MKSGNWLAAGGLLMGVVFLPCGGLAQSYDAWRAWPDDYRRGFALAIVMEQLSTCLGEGCSITRHRRHCLAGMTDKAVVELFGHYVDRHPQARSRPINVTMSQALYELCGPAP